MNYKITARKIKDKNGNVVRIQKCIIADMEKITPAEDKLIDKYLKTGEYILLQKRVKKTTGKGITKAKMIEYLKENDADGLKELEKKVKAKENFMRITTWFKKQYPNYED